MSSHPLDDLPRVWWFPDLSGYREMPEHETYQQFDLDSQPLIKGLTGGLEWLPRSEEAPEWSITLDDDGEPTYLQSREKLERLGLASEGIDPAVQTFLDTAELQRTIRSSTGCYLDLGDFAVSIEGATDSLLHLLSDQQWCKHWYVYCSDGPHRGVVLASDIPYGFSQQDWFETVVPTQLPPTLAGDISVVADSFEEFLKRLWLENELFYATTSDPAALENEQVSGYARQLRA